MRKKIVAGNWKMHGSRASVDALAQLIKQGTESFSSELDIIVFPSFVFLQQVADIFANTLVAWGGQNLYLGAQGAFTGEISSPMLRDFGCQYVLIGHSERRTVFQEDLSLIAAKLKTALEFSLKPVLCLGESLAQREEGKTQAVLTEQLESAIELVGIEAFQQVIIAYEPVWAIGTGLTATPEQAQDAHAFIRQRLVKHNVDIGNALRILYGGSVKADNAAGLFSKPDIDGGLVGGASLDAKNFLEICEAAQALSVMPAKAGV